MNTYRWFKIGKISGSFGSSDLSLLAVPDQGDEWFEIDREAEDAIDARFFQKIKLSYDQLSPSGAIDANTLECVRSVLFRVSTRDGLSTVRVQDNMRVVTSLLASLARKLGFGFYIEPIGFRSALDLFAVKGLASLSSYDSARIVSAKASGADISAGIVGRFEFSSKAGFEISDISSRLPSGFRLESVKAEVTKVGASGAFTFSSIGRCSISGRLSPFILEDVENRLIYGSFGMGAKGPPFGFR